MELYQCGCVKRGAGNEELTGFDSQPSVVGVNDRFDLKVELFLF